MISWLKKYFVPHERNNYEPQLLKTEALALLLALVVIIELIYLVPTFFIIPTERFGATVLPAVLIDLANADRLASRLPRLRPNNLLAKAATAKAQDMATRGYFSHVDPDGRAPWYWFDKIGYRYAQAGENLAINFFDSADIEKAWMNSPLHRENILKRQFTEIGIGSASGYYRGYQTTFVVQFFGKPAGRADASADEFTLDQSFLSRDQVAAAGLLSFADRSSWSNFVNRIIASPRTLTNTIFAILVLIILATTVPLLIDRRHGQKRKLFANALLILVLILLIIIFNRQLSAGRAEIADLPADTIVASI